MLLTFLQGFAWLAFGAAIASSVQMWLADRHMQEFRHPQEPLARFVLVPLRWQADLYTPDGQRFVTQAWRAFGRMFGFFLLGAILQMIVIAFRDGAA